MQIMELFPIIASISSQIASASASNWIDLVAIVIVLSCVTWDAIRGFSATLAHVAALLIAFKLSFSICPWVRSALSSVGGSSSLAAILPFVAAIVILVILFLLLRFLLAKFVQVLVKSPTDNILGAITGLAKGLLILFLIFAALAIILGKSYDSSAFASSWTGKKVFPVLEKTVSPAYRQAIGEGKKD